jgi:bacteriocin biosynthesis cyclodehydratase domain-containing protein
LRRRGDQWQVGLDPSHRVLLRTTGRHPPPVAGPDLPPGTVFCSALPAPGSCPPSVRETLAALARETGDACPAVVERRAAHLVRVETFGPAAGAALAHELLDVCFRTGLRLPPLPSSPRSPPPPVSSPRSPPPQPASDPRGRHRRTTVVAVVGLGEPSREVLDRLVRDQTAHLLVRLAEGRAVLGPFVVPGQTPCLRCLDAHQTDADASWPLLVEQYVRAVRTDRADGVPEPVDAALATLAAAWAARDLATYAEGGTPTTLATTIEVGPRLESVETRHWSPHPRCGCSWR